ncbi:MAG: PQQ-dependent sugar dehydrogenase [Nitrososphaerales archaeon]
MINYNFKTANIWIFGYSRIVLIALLSMASFVGVLILLNTMYSFVLAHEDYADIKIMDPKLRFDVVATDFKFPTGIAFLGNNDLLLIEKNTGNVIRVQNGTETKPLLTLSIANQSERGLLGLAVTEMGSIPRYVFLYYTEADKTNPNNVLGNRVYRYELVDNELVNRKLLLSLPSFPGLSHDGGVLKIGPDNKSLYVVIGNVNYLQNSTYMTTTQNVKNGPSPDGRGGILRITFDGSVVGSKGILGNSKYLSLYYGYGLRNSFGIGFDPLTGNLWDTENGQRTNDEINLVKPGFNSGWKVIQGTSALNHLDESELENFNGRGRYRDPEFDWVTTVAPTSVLFFNSDKLGKNYENDLFVGSVHNGTIYHFDLTKDRTHLDLKGELVDKIANTANEVKEIMFAKGMGLITDLEKAPDGYMYVLVSYKHDGTIFRIRSNS